MTVAYWVVAGLLALLYLFSGSIKIVRSQARLQPMMNWVDSIPMPLVRTIGVLEVLGAIGLILPPLTGVAPWLAFVAAVGFVLLQIAAITLHLRRGEAKLIPFNLFLLAWGIATAWLATVWL